MEEEENSERVHAYVFHVAGVGMQRGEHEQEKKE